MFSRTTVSQCIAPSTNTNTNTNNIQITRVKPWMID